MCYPETANCVRDRGGILFIVMPSAVEAGNEKIKPIARAAGNAQKSKPNTPEISIDARGITKQCLKFLAANLRVSLRLGESPCYMKNFK